MIYKYIYVFIEVFIVFYLQIISSTKNNQLEIKDKGLEHVVPSAVALVFFVNIKNLANDEFEVELNPDYCCLETDGAVDCNIMGMEGSCVEVIPQGETKTLKLVAPLLEQMDRNGYCIFFIDSKMSNNNVMRDKIKVNFDTNSNLEKPNVASSNVTRCKDVDEDPSNNCKPVDCEKHYNGVKPYYNKRLRRCTSAPKCIDDVDDHNDLPSIIYDPVKNKCVVGKSVTQNDIAMFKTINISKRRFPKDIVIFGKDSNPSKVPYSSAETSTSLACLDTLTHMDRYSGHNFTFYMFGNKYTLIALIIIVVVQCCIIFTIMCYFTKKCKAPKQDKKIIRQFFHARHDASVTTPLINTSHIDTETTDAFMSESNADKKIKDYRACHKEYMSSIKTCLSDDILCKCLNKRDCNKSVRSEAVGENVTHIERTVETTEVKMRNADTQVNTCGAQCKYNAYHYRKPKPLKVIQTKINYENEIPPKPPKENIPAKIVKSFTKRFDKIGRYHRITPREEELVFRTSEKELKCLSYNNNNTDTDNRSFKEEKKTKKCTIFPTEMNKSVSASKLGEKAVQAAFCKDSIDDLLSEKGMLYMAAGDLSKYSLSSVTQDAEQTSNLSGSSKTSKNFVKNVLSLLHKKSKSAANLESERKKSVESYDVELLHMSTMSAYSSSNEE